MLYKRGDCGSIPVHRGSLTFYFSFFIFALPQILNNSYMKTSAATVFVGKAWPNSTFMQPHCEWHSEWCACVGTAQAIWEVAVQHESKEQLSHGVRSER